MGINKLANQWLTQNNNTPQLLIVYVAMLEIS